MTGETNLPGHYYTVQYKKSSRQSGEHGITSKYSNIYLKNRPANGFENNTD